MAEWRSTFGSAAIAMINALFESNKNNEAVQTDEDRVEYAKHMLENLRFLYSTADGDDQRVMSNSLIYHIPTDILMATPRITAACSAPLLSFKRLPHILWQYMAI